MKGRGGRVTQRYSCKEKLNEEKSCCELTPKKIIMYWLEKNSFKENDNEKKSTMRLKNPHNKCRSIFGTISNLLGLTDSCQGTYPLKDGSSLINNDI